jgi:transcriptional regulator with XRE-family HTH domain
LTLFANTARVKILSMTLIRITGSQLHAARILVGLSREEIAKRAGLCRHSLMKWEGSSHAVPGAMYSHLLRVIDVLEAEGARFTGDNGVARPAPIAGTVLRSEGAAA